jgi:excinuclease ABC subunit A
MAPNITKPPDDAPVLTIRGAAENNLRGVDVDIRHGTIVAITGVSGSGKSSLAFDTVFAEARRRFLLTAGGAATAFAERLSPPEVERLEGLPPALAIAQARQRPSSRSTAATVTGIADVLRVLFARAGQAHCLRCDTPLRVQRFDEVCEIAAGRPEGTRLVILAPLGAVDDGAAATERLADVERAGFRRLRVDGETKLLDEVAAGELAGTRLEVVVDRVVVKAESRRRLRGSIEAAADAGGGAVILVDHDSGDEQRFSVRPGCAACGATFPEITPALFSFNSPAGACPACRGTGQSAEAAFERLLSPGEAPASVLAPLWERFGHKELRKELTAFARRAPADLDAPLSEWGEAAVEALWQGESSDLRGAFPGLRRRLSALLGRSDDPAEAAWLEERADSTATPCATCGGRRFSPAALAVRVDGDSLADWLARPVARLRPRLDDLDLAPELRAPAQRLLESLRISLTSLEDLGLSYLTLDRRARSLSAGELQRLHLVAALGTGLSQVLYVLDEPSAGLHARDTDRLRAALARLRDRGNTLLLVEHDLDLIGGADAVIEIGPGAGREGGRLVAEGPPDGLAQGNTPTGLALAGAGALPSRARQAGAGGWLRLRRARGHNLQELDVDIPLACLACVSGVSGSGKSSLVHDTLYPLLSARLQGGERHPLPVDGIDGVEQLERVVAVDQAPIGRSSRSNAATYTGLMAPLRDLFSQVPEARLRGYTPGQFSFNSRGACEACGGSGREAAGEEFDDLPLPCPVCGGSRYRREVLEIRYADLTIADVLRLSVAEALERFAPVPEAARRLQLLVDLGLGYLHLGQPASTLSGGEAQRVKLAAELGRPLQEHTLYILDEPTSGLHRQDTVFLVELLQRLVERNNSVLVVEHDLGVIAAADHIIDLGPESGEEGGRVVVAGPPEVVAACEASHTGRHLAARLSHTRSHSKGV